jgi:hypothetical protein
VAAPIPSLIALIAGRQVALTLELGLKVTRGISFHSILALGSVWAFGDFDGFGGFVVSVVLVVFGHFQDSGCFAGFRSFLLWLFFDWHWSGRLGRFQSFAVSVVSMLWTFLEVLPFLAKVVVF